MTGILLLLLFATVARAQDNVPLVEVRCDEFFNQSSLKGLKFGVSTREDVKKAFGTHCPSGCDFDDQWKIKFGYFATVSKSAKVGDKWNSYLPNRDYWGKLYQIQLLPRQRIAFGRYKFTNCFILEEDKNKVLPYLTGATYASNCSPLTLKDFDKCDLESINLNVSAELEEKMFILHSSRPYSSLGQTQ